LGNQPTFWGKCLVLFRVTDTVLEGSQN